MKQRWWLRGVGLFATLSLACGDAEIDPLDPSTFAGMHKGQIEYDCTQTVQCRTQMGMEVLNDPVNTCVRDTAVHLENLPEAGKNQFLVNYNACANFVVCDYLNCAQADAAGWGETQMDKVTYDCQQEIECGRQSGTFTGDIPSALNSCITLNLGLLRNFSPQQRDQYVASYTACSMKLACDFKSCFMF